MNTSHDFSGSVVTVSGAATGIGRDAAMAFASAGASVWLLDIDDERGSASTSSIQDSGGDARYVHCDITDSASVADAIELIGSASSGCLDVLVNNAGGFWQQRSVEDTSEDEWRSVVDLNLTGTFLLTKASIPLLKASPQGRIISIGSLAGQTTMYRSSPPYAAAKAGVHALTRALAFDLAGDGITANALAPSAILTDRVIAVRGPDERAETARNIPVGRYGEPADVVETILFLASDSASYITGQTIAINGGRFMT